jgi:murein DD-endopeptidase MepM/ murein hydrolase activator NlpD
MHVRPSVAVAAALLLGAAAAPQAVRAATRGTAGPAGGAPAAVIEYVAPLPVPLTVLRGFDPPATPYGPGHLGVDLRAAAGSAVHAAAVGVVRFAGQVAGRGVVVLVHADGISTEYEPLRPLVQAGARVLRGAVLGTVTGRHRGCRVDCLHWGARRGAAYLDPLSLLRPLGPVVLLPWSADP